MQYGFLSIISSAFIFLGYFPEMYSTVRQIKNHPSIKYSWIFWICAGIFNITYSSLNREYFTMGNYSLTLLMNLIVLSLKAYYAQHYLEKVENLVTEQKHIEMI